MGSSGGPLRSYTVVTCHFGDLFWVSHMLRQVDRLSDERVAGVVVVDQNRRDRDALEALPRVTRVVEFEPDAACTAALGHDHPVALNRVLRETEFTTSHVLLLDSDCFPLDASWLDRLDDITFAGDSPQHGLTHPCLMAFPVRLIGSLDFMEDVERRAFDTGRLVGSQAKRAGETFTIAEPAKQQAFGNTRGTLFLDGAVYHHQSASFVSSGSRAVRRQVISAIEERYRRQVAAGSFELDPGLAVMVRLGRIAWRVRERLAAKPTLVRFVQTIKRNLIHRRA